MKTREATNTSFKRLQSLFQHLKNEIKHLKKMFRDINGYPNWIIEQIIEKVQNNKNEMVRPGNN